MVWSQDSFEEKQEKIKRKCFHCGKILTGSMSGEENQDFSEAPNDALVATIYGNYGSTIFDPSPHEKTSLELYICDYCIVSYQNRIYKVVNGKIEECDFQEE